MANNDKTSAKQEDGYKVFCDALEFTKAHHKPDFDWITSRQSLTTDFNELFEEFCYVVVASGFKGKTAAVLAPQLATLKGNMEGMQKVFKNTKKTFSIHKFYEMFKKDTEYNSFTKDKSSPQQRTSIKEEEKEEGEKGEREKSEHSYKLEDVKVPEEISAQKFVNFLNNIKEPTDLAGLPYIGKITCNHLSRNIGLKQMVKPDLHLTRMAEEYLYETPDIMVKTFVKLYKEKHKNEDLQLGAADFVLWVYLSHEKGKLNDCCDGGYRLR